MVVLSLNIRGIGGTLKVASFRRLLERTKPDIIFLQETLSADKKARDFVHQFRTSWVTAAVSSIGNSSGLLVAWDPSLFDLRPFLSCGGILLSGCCLASKLEMALLNIYGPCSERPQFWSQLADSGILSLPNLILGGDLNIFLSADETWGGSYLSGPTEAYYKELFASNNLIDVRPTRLTPTWRNGRTGPDAIARRLDRFLVADGFLSTSGLPSSWVEFPFFSDHAPILLQLRLTELPRSPPFKFNHSWLTSADYTDLVKLVWTDPRFISEVNPQLRLTWKLKVLKSKSKSWYHRKKAEDQARLLSLETEITKLILCSTTTAWTVEESDRLKRLESNRDSIAARRGKLLAST
jgi:endonuclease/exonuclease/phosphatase family metal-dependent hydrolase